MSVNTTSSGPPKGMGGLPSPTDGPPYFIPASVLGGLPNTSVDVPATAVFMVIFMCGAALNMSIIISNRRRGHKFLLSNIFFGFCMARTVSCIMRIVWAYRPTNISVAIAAQIFIAAGVILLIIANLIFTQRLIRASYPKIGWSKPVAIGFLLFYISVLLLLIALITCVVQEFYTLSTNTRRIDVDVQHTGQTYFAAAAFFPIPTILIGFLLSHLRPHLPPPKSTEKPSTHSVDKFGTGSHQTKVLLLLFTATLLTLGASFRAGTFFYPRPITNPAWYHSKACFYIFNFSLEVLVIGTYLAFRVDRRFWVPNGADGGYGLEGGKGKKRFSIRFQDEEIFFDFGSWREEGLGELEMAAAWGKRLRGELEGRMERVGKEEV